MEQLLHMYFFFFFFALLSSVQIENPEGMTALYFTNESTRAQEVKCFQGCCWMNGTPAQ